MRRLPAAVLLVAAILATAALWTVSRGKWSDPIIDTGIEWFYADALSRGALLYRDVVYWFGPFTPYFHAAFFALLGSSFSTLVLTGVVMCSGTLAALYLALRRVTGRAEAAAAVALAVPVLVFMPGGGGAILGMGYRMWEAAAFALVAVALAAGRPSGPWRSAAVGGLCALAGLCRTEWGVASLLAAGTATWIRGGSLRDRVHDVLIACVAFLALFGGTMGVFVAVSGSKAVLRDGHLLLTGLPPETRRHLLNISGLRDPAGGFLRLLYSASMWGTIFLVVEVASTWKNDPDRLRRRLPWLGGALVFLLVYSNYAGSTTMLFFSGVPLIAAAAAGVGFLRGRGPRAAALAGYGLLGLMVCLRKPFSIADSPYVAPPLIVALVCGIGLLASAVSGERIRSARVRLRWALFAMVVLLAGFSFAARTVQYSRDPRVPLPGTGGWLSAPPEAARAITLLVREIRERTRPDDGLVVFPEGQVINFLSGRRNPIRFNLFIPGYLTDTNELEIIGELSRVKPAAVVIVNRQTSEYGRRFFGKNYGRRVWSWIEENYEPRPFDEAAAESSVSVARLYLRKTPP